MRAEGEDHERRCGRMPWIRGGCALEYGHEGDHVFLAPPPQDEDHEANTNERDEDHDA
jgi:hypothetical protein